jgi:hypothetical protein
MISFVTWLFSDAGAGWIFGVVSLLTLIISILYRRKGRHIVFRELETASLIDIQKEVRDRIKVNYDGREIHALGFVKGELFNPGFDVIKDCHIKLSLPHPAQIIDVTVASSLDDCILTTTVQDQIATIAVPFLNSYRGHRHTIVIAMTYDGNPEDVAIIGSGAGWSLVRIGVRGQSVHRMGQIIIAALGLLASALLTQFWYVGWVEKHYGIGENEISFRAFVATIPFIVVLLFFTWLLLYYSREPKPRSAKETLDKIKSA